MSKEVIKSPSQDNTFAIGQLLQKSLDEQTVAEREALQLHGQLVYDRQMVSVGIVSMCRDLKDIRDGKHYVTLGFSDFGEYTEQMHGIGARQAYNYIRVYEQLDVEVLNLTSKIGVTKLLELASLNNDEQKELLAEHSPEELDNMSTAEVKRLTAEVKHLEEQLSFFENNAIDQQDNSAELRAEIEQQLRSEYDKRISEAQAVANQEKLKALAEQRDEMIKLKADLKQAKADLNSNSKSVKEAEARAKAAEEKAAQASEFEFKFKNAEAEKAEMEKQIRLSSDPELTRFKFLFENWQTVTATMFEQLSRLDVETQNKMRAAVNAVIGEQLC